MVYFAVYLEHANSPAALFVDEEEAMRWGFDNALIYVSVRPVHVPDLEPMKEEPDGSGQH